MNRRQRARDFWGHMLQFRIPSTPLSRATIWTAGGYAIWQGVGILIGGAHRWTGPAYSVVLQAPGAPPSWGWASLILGLVIFAGSFGHLWRVKAVGLLGLSGWSMAFATGAQAATMTVATAGTTGGPAYAYIAISTAILVWVEETGRRRVRRNHAK